MGSLAISRLNECVTDDAVTADLRRLRLIPQPDQNARVAFIPLLRQTNDPPPFAETSFEQSLIVTVQLNSAKVQQHWLLDPSGTPNKFGPRSVTFGSKEYASQSQNAGAFDSVQYYLPRASLNEFTDARGLARVSIEHDEASFVCLVFTRLSYLILARLGSPELFSSAFMDHFVDLFCAHVVHLRTFGLSDRATHHGGLSACHKRRVMEILSKAAYTNVKLAFVAKECGLSVSHFARSFKTTFGMPVHRWVTEQRVTRAKKLLLNSNDSLLEIAFLAGFSDQASFNRTFAKLTGTSPGRWRRDFRT